MQQGTDRRMKLRSNEFEKNLGAKQQGKEVPQSLQRPAKDDKIPVSPMILGLFLFLVIGSALFQLLSASSQAGMVE